MEKLQCTLGLSKNTKLFSDFSSSSIIILQILNLLLNNKGDPNVTNDAGEIAIKGASIKLLQDIFVAKVNIDGKINKKKKENKMDINVHQMLKRK